MRQLARPFVAAVAVLGLAGCSAGTSADPEPGPPSEKPGSALANLDPCDIMTPQQLQQGSFEFDGREKTLDYEPGCNYLNDTVALGIFRNASPLDSVKEDRDWKTYDPMQLNGRAAARVTIPTDTEDACSTMFSTGGGVVRVYAFSADPRQPIDGCAESLKIAKQIEPNLPE